MPLDTSFDVELSQCLSSLLTELHYEVQDRGNFPDDASHYVQGVRFHTMMSDLLHEVMGIYISSPKQEGFVDLLCRVIRERLMVEWK